MFSAVVLIALLSGFMQVYDEATPLHPLLIESDGNCFNKALKYQNIGHPKIKDRHFAFHLLL